MGATILKGSYSPTMSHDSNTDLAEFAKTRDDAAFRRVVGQFGKLVLNAAHRRTSDRQMAEEIAQNVFAIMARKARHLSKHRSIAGWVFTTTRLEAAKAMRGRQRHQRKLQALADEIQHSTDMSDEGLENWRDALPHLEAGLDQLRDADREAVLARFFENKSFRQIAAADGCSEATCRMRVHRSLDKLKGWMARRGVTLSAAAIGSALAAEWTQAAPAAAIETLSGNALTAAPAIGTGTILSNSIMTMNAVKAASLAAATVVLIGTIPLVIQQSKAKQLEAQIAQLGEPIPQPAPTRPKLTALDQPTAKALGPASHLLQEARLPSDAEELTDVLLDAILAQDLGALMRAMVALGRMDRAEIDQLITEVNESDMFLGKKQAARRMLIGFMDPDESNGVALLEKAIDSDVQLFHTLKKRLARWAENDPAAAEAWLQQHLDDPRLDRNTGSNRIGVLIWEAIVPGMARTDPALAVASLDALGSRAKWTTVAAAAGSIIGRGEEGDVERAREVLLRLEEDHRQGGISTASQQAMKSVGQFDAFIELARSLDYPEKNFASMAYWMATTQTNLPVRERADWVLENVGTQSTSALQNFIWNTRQREVELGVWISELPPGSFKDHALRGEISALVNNLHDSGEAITRARLISDDEMRAEALRFTLQKFPSAGELAPTKDAKQVAEMAAALANLPAKTPTPAPASEAAK